VEKERGNYFGDSKDMNKTIQSPEYRKHWEEQLKKEPNSLLK
jgi:hypothetical protein